MAKQRSLLHAAKTFLFMCQHHEIHHLGGGHLLLEFSNFYFLCIFVNESKVQ